MLKKCILFLVVAGLAACVFASGKMTATLDKKVFERLTGDEPINAPVYSGEITLVSPGQRIGDTYYDAQHNSALNRMIQIDVDQAIQAVWTKAWDSGHVIRHVQYNNSDWWPPSGTDTAGVQIDPGSSIRAGYITFDVLSDGRGVAFYHAKMPATADFAASCAVDIIPRLGSFQQVLIDTITFPPTEATMTIWPHGAVDLQDNIHVVSSQFPAAAGDSAIVSYSRSTDDGMNWDSWVTFDTLYDLSYDVTTSWQSGKVCIAYTDNVGWASGQVNNDVYYIESTDYGVTWDWTAKNNVTNFIPVDTTRAYCDVNGVYDNDDSLHLVYPLRWVQNDTHWTPGSYASYIEHWSKATGRTIVCLDTLIGWHGTYEAGGWRLHSDHPSIGVDTTTGFLYCIFAGNPWGDTSAMGYPNYDIFGSYSTDGGATWSRAVNMSNTSSKDCSAGNCDSEDYATLAEMVNDTLHICFVEDKDAGAAVGTAPEGSVTLNPIRYWKVPAEMLVVGVEEKGPKSIRPSDFSLAQNVPNPFAKRTVIQYELPGAAHVRVLVYDATGRLVEVLVDGNKNAGVHETAWDAGRLASGIYFYKIVTPGYTSTKKMVHLR